MSIADAVSQAMFSRPREITPLDIKDEIAAYKAPIPLRGTRVEWFKNAQRNGRGLIGFIQAVAPNGVTVDLYVPGNIYPGMAHVRHMSDPQLKIAANREESGGWDYSEEWYADQELKRSVEDKLTGLGVLVDALNSRLAAVESFINDVKTPTTKKKAE